MKQMTKKNSPHYTVVIQWSDEDGCFIASLPEWSSQAVTHAHGATYEEAAKNASQVLKLLMADENGRPVQLPPEKLFQYPGADVVNLPDHESGSRRPPATGPKSRRSA